ncbi:MAG: tetratricopeptide repeat protein, partial [Ferruginibacter sp.]|nr:tetratricopeptide repeat protein [Ferruginibacter sp.]
MLHKIFFLLNFLLLGSVRLFAQTTDSSDYYYNIGLEEKNANKFQLAANSFDKALEFNPTNIDVLMANAYVHMEMRRMDKSIVFFDKVHQLDPGNTKPIKELMNLYYNYHRYDKAIDFANKCKDCNESVRIIGMSAYQQEDYTLSAQKLTEYLSKNPKDAEATYTLARTYIDMEEYNKAIPLLDSAVTFPEAKSMWMYEQAILNYNMGFYKKATAAFQNAIDHGHHQSSDFKENHGFSCLYSGDLDKGEKLLMEVWSKKTGNKDILRGTSEVLFQLNQFDRSLKYCQKLLELDP